MKPHIKIRDIHKKFGETGVLNGANLDVGEGEVVSIIGHSGSGKTTLLKIIAGLEKPDAGSVEPMNDNLGIVFQEFNLWPHMNVLNNVALAPALVKREPKEKAEKKAIEILAKVGLSHKADKYPLQLSHLTVNSSTKNLTVTQGGQVSAPALGRGKTEGRDSEGACNEPESASP